MHMCRLGMVVLLWLALSDAEGHCVIPRQALQYTENCC